MDYLMEAERVICKELNRKGGNRIRKSSKEEIVRETGYM